MLDHQKKMLVEILEVEDQLNDWERGFCNDLYRRDYALSDPQEAKVTQIYNRYILGENQTGKANVPLEYDRCRAVSVSGEGYMIETEIGVIGPPKTKKEAATIAKWFNEVWQTILDKLTGGASTTQTREEEEDADPF